MEDRLLFRGQDLRGNTMRYGRLANDLTPYYTYYMREQFLQELDNRLKGGVPKTFIKTLKNVKSDIESILGGAE